MTDKLNYIIEIYKVVKEEDLLSKFVGFNEIEDVEWKYSFPMVFNSLKGYSFWRIKEICREKKVTVI